MLDASASRTTVGSKLDQERATSKRIQVVAVRFSSSISETVTFEAGWGLGPATGVFALMPGQVSPQTTGTRARLGQITNQSCKMATDQLPFLRRRGQKQNTAHTSPARGGPLLKPNPPSCPYLHPFKEPSCSPRRWSWVPDTCSLSLLRAAA